MSTVFSANGGGQSVFQQLGGGSSFLTLTAAPAPSGPSATGGTVTTYSSGGTNYKVHTFTSSGTFTVTAGGSVDVLCVGGGGASLFWVSNGQGAGGGGGYVTSSTLSVSPGAISVTVGSGGYSTITDPYAPSWSIVSGTASSFGGFVSASPGGDASWNPSTYLAGGSSQSGTPPADFAHFGGAGAGTLSPDVNSGGNGIQSGISGTATYYGGGGAGADGGSYPSSASGGLGGGGQNGTYYQSATSGTPNSGGGAGGGVSYPTPTTTGGSGIVIIRYVI